MEWYQESDWWLLQAIDAHMRSRFSERWETQCWLNLLFWQAEEPLVWPIVDWAGNVALDKPPRVLIYYSGGGSNSLGGESGG